ncbi:N-acetylglucosamine-6-phosphate deacetylase [Cystobacter fuscus]
MSLTPQPVHPTVPQQVPAMAREAAQAADAARQQIARCSGTFAELGERLRQHPPRFIITCARGSSDHAASYGKYLIETTLGRAVASVGPSVASVYNTPLDWKDSLFIAVSQSGRSPDLLRLTEAAREAGALVVGFVNHEDSPLMRMCDVGIPLCAGPEQSVAATKSYLLSGLAFLQLVAHWSGEPELRDAVTRLPEALEAARALDWSPALLRLADARGLYVLGRGIGLGAALEMALKFKETCRLHAEPSAPPRCSTARWPWWAPASPCWRSARRTTPRAAPGTWCAGSSSWAPRSARCSTCPARRHCLPSPASPPPSPPCARCRASTWRCTGWPWRAGSTRTRPPPAQSDGDRVMRRVLSGARVFTGEQFVDGHCVVLEDGHVAAVVPAPSAPTDAEQVRLPGDSLLVPGFIDTQVNGAGGVLFNDTPTAEAALAIAAASRRSGTTGLLPTFITDEQAKMQRACEATLEAMARPASGVLGIHLEGPFISGDRPGVHDPRFIRTPDARDLDYLMTLPRRLAAHTGRLLMTLAPERVEDGVLQRLASAGVLLAAGHTAAPYERTRDSLRAGVRGFTHLFNAMPPLSNRQPGPALAALESEEAWCGVIADGIHVHPSLLRLLVKSKPAGKVYLVTDAMPPVGTDASSFTLYGHTILRRDGRLVTENGTLAGADIDMATSVRNCVRLLGLPLEDSLRMASLYPASFLGLEGQLGRIARGYRADLALLRPDLTVLATWVAGQAQWY